MSLLPDPSWGLAAAPLDLLPAPLPPLQPSLPEVALQGPGQLWPLLPVGGTQPQVLHATPSEMSLVPGAGDPSGTAAASS